jgi:hypothetical protein
MQKKLVHHIIDTLTPDAIMARLDVSFHMIRYARSSGVFPSGWYDDIDKMCRDAGLECPRNLFNWNSARRQARATSAADTRGAA